MRRDWSIKPLARMGCGVDASADDELAMREVDRAAYRSDSLAVDDGGADMSDADYAALQNDAASFGSSGSLNVNPIVTQAAGVFSGALPNMPGSTGGGGGRLINFNTSRSAAMLSRANVGAVGAVQPFRASSGGGVAGLGALSDTTKNYLIIGGVVVGIGALLYFAFGKSKRQRGPARRRVSFSEPAA